jgi:RNA-directed DNA polymerase
MADVHKILATWDAFFRIRITSKRHLAAYNLFVRQLVEKDLPVIFDLGHLAALLGLEKIDLARIVGAPSRFYREFTIPKRRGGEREIAAPYPLLLEIQRWIGKNILLKEVVHDAAQGFVVGRSIVTNAKMHVGVPCILKMDIAEFFPSISIARVIGIFQGAGYPPKVAYYLASLCCRDGRLPQGAATSPAISNIVGKPIDRRIAGLAARLNLNYTRYADDMTLSGRSIPLDLPARVEKIVRAEGFSINGGKTVLSLHGGKRIVTGLSVSGDVPKLPRKKRREIRKEVHFLNRFGFHKHSERIGSADPLYLERLLGQLAFWGQVEPDNMYVRNAISIVQSHRRVLGIP